MKSSETTYKKVVLLSGGLDSSANLALCLNEVSSQEVLALTLDYSQRAVIPELKASRELCQHYGVRQEVTSLPFFKGLGKSALTQTDELLPELHRNELDLLSVTQKTAEKVWVPNRNGVFISVASALAEAYGASEVVVGFNREEAATFPDNSEAYLQKMTESLSYSTQNHVALRCYTLRMDKKEIIQALRKLSKPFPFELIWSCYTGNEKACGRCESCQRFERAWELSKDGYDQNRSQS